MVDRNVYFAKLFPFISSGFSMPINCNTVGAMSASLPVWRLSRFLYVSPLLDEPSFYKGTIRNI